MRKSIAPQQDETSETLIQAELIGDVWPVEELPLASARASCTAPALPESSVFAEPAAMMSTVPC